MEESKELQGFYKIFRAVIYISVLMEFFEYAIDPRTIDGFGGVVCELHDRIKQWFIYHDGNLVYSKVVTFLLYRAAHIVCGIVPSQWSRWQALRHLHAFPPWVSNAQYC